MTEGGTQTNYEFLTVGGSGRLLQSKRAHVLETIVPTIDIVTMTGPECVVHFRCQEGIKKKRALRSKWSLAGDFAQDGTNARELLPQAQKRRHGQEGHHVHK